MEKIIGKSMVREETPYARCKALQPGCSTLVESGLLRCGPRSPCPVRVKLLPPCYRKSRDILFDSREGCAVDRGYVLADIRFASLRFARVAVLVPRGHVFGVGLDG